MTTIAIPARPETFALDAARAALVVVDMQNAYLSPGGYLDTVGFEVGSSGPAVAAAAAVLGAARAAGLFVAHLQNGFDRDQTEAGGPASPVWHKSNALRHMRAHPETRGTLITHGTWDHAFVDPMRPRPGEAMVLKARYSGFAGTNLEQLLRARGVTHLILVGVATNVCVESTLRDAYHREFFALMVRDATHQAGPEAVFGASVFNVERFFGWTAAAADVAEALHGRPSRAA
ncbi:Peroxyureidoacrylate/ureidoacrylate amidohydrolase RutB [Methylobacterium crusticola]|uniref:Peroxyureidoacrylate/ureidoacrylate amidohydrolase RutB n=1 Tax=Methylobacterium crusticola TaxID=1697972 RepID=A0ABQ4R1B1_9HYPH|nr:isochorismatase family protein [Methylobacterium crusticola]GJD50915.1 Peroxyureidoacrylate/ureidoacrylate amidohydrolase RutB [Methylobacterium crusticola]